VHPTTTESWIDELDEVVVAIVVPSEIDGSIISNAVSALAMNGKAFCYSVGLSSSSSSWSSIFMIFL
jgi:hypothetical protein